MKITEAEARAAILANGYKIARELPRRVCVYEPGKGSRAREWMGVNWRDLATTFKLDKRKAGD